MPSEHATAIAGVVVLISSGCGPGVSLDPPAFLGKDRRELGEDGGTVDSGGAEHAGTMTLRVQLAGAQARHARVVSDRGVIYCEKESCEVQVPPGTEDTLRALIDARTGTWFRSWGGACQGKQPACTVRVNEDTVVTAFFDPVNYMFVTSAPITWTDVLVGDPRAAADEICTAAAGGASLPGTKWVAWLSATSNGYRLADFGDAQGWVRPDDLPFANSVNQLLRGQVFYPPRITEDEEDVGAAVALTGTLRDGTTPFGSGRCNGWTDPASTAIVGEATGGSGAWTESPWRVVSCAESNVHLYCFGADYQTEIEPPAAAGRGAFLSSALFSPTMDGPGGRDAADVICQSEANLSTTLPSGTYLALLWLVTEPGWARFPLDGAPPWVRVDGIPLSAAPRDLFDAQAAVDNKILAALSVTSTGVYLMNAQVWTGVGSVGGPGSTESTCFDWRSPNGVQGTFGESSLAAVKDAASYLHNTLATRPCTSRLPVYCLQL